MLKISMCFLHPLGVCCKDPGVPRSPSFPCFCLGSQMLVSFQNPGCHNQNKFLETSFEIGLASQRNPRGRIPQNCCGDCWGDCRGKSECRGECCGAVPGDLPRDCRGECQETALSCEEQRRAVSRHSPRQSLGRSPALPRSTPPGTPIFPGSPPSSLRSSFGEFGLGGSSGWPAQSQNLFRSSGN